MPTYTTAEAVVEGVRAHAHHRGSIVYYEHLQTRTIGFECQHAHCSSRWECFWTVDPNEARNYCAPRGLISGSNHLETMARLLTAIWGESNVAGNAPIEEERRVKPLPFVLAKPVLVVRINEPGWYNVEGIGAGSFESAGLYAYEETARGVVYWSLQIPEENFHHIYVPVRVEPEPEPALPGPPRFERDLDLG